MNIKQKDGLAAASDNVAVGSLFGGVGGWFTDNIKWYIGVAMIFAAVAAYIFAFILIKDGE